MSEWRIYVRDRFRRRIGEITDYRALTLNLIFNDVSTWELEMEASSPLAAELRTYGQGIIVTRNDEPVLTGFINSDERDWRVSDDGQVTDRLSITGVDDTWLLFTRLAYPVRLGPPYTAQAYDVKTGQASTVMRQYVADNAAGNAHSARGYSTLDVDDDPLLGSTVTGRARFQHLTGLLQSLATAGGGLGFRVLQIDDRAKFQVYQPVDRSTSVVFAPERGTLRGFRYTRKAPTGNYILAGGSGEGAARMIVEGGDTASMTDYGRVEQFADKRGIDDLTELEQALDEELANRADQWEIQIEPIDTAQQRFMEHYNLGDLVTVVTPEGTLVQMIRSVRVDLTPDAGVVVRPTVGTPVPASQPGFFGQYDQLRQRVSHLERR